LKPGDLVKMKSNIRRRSHSGDIFGLVTEHFAAEGRLVECVRVRWPLGDDIEIAHQLEVVSESR